MPMPLISMFFGIIITMNARERNPPHFHAKYQEYSGMFNFEGEMIEGDMPGGKIKYIAAWAELHKDELEANWELAVNGEKPYKIDPLRA
jgi:hypothetical protein